MLNLRDASERAGASTSSVRRAIKSGRLSCGVRIDPAEIARAYPPRPERAGTGSAAQTGPDALRSRNSRNVSPCRRPSEIVAIRRTLEPLERERAKERMSEGGKGVETFHTLPGKTRDKVAAFAGISGRTLDKITAIVDAAEAEPDRFGKLEADMTRTGRVDGPYKRLKVARQAEQIRAEPPPLPGQGPYRVISRGWWPWRRAG